MPVGSVETPDSVVLGSSRGRARHEIGRPAQCAGRPSSLSGGCRAVRRYHQPPIPRLEAVSTRERIESADSLVGSSARARFTSVSA
jgi:hypothetical protein